METFLFFVAFVLSLLHSPPNSPTTVSSGEKDALEVIWASMYPELAIAGWSEPAALPGPSSAEVPGTARYATHRVLWRNFLAAQVENKTPRTEPAPPSPTFRAEPAPTPTSPHEAALLAVEAQIVERLRYSTEATARKASSAGLLSPSERDLADAFMDLSDLGIRLQASPPETSSPLLASFLALYQPGADQAQWDDFASQVLQARFQDGAHLAARAPLPLLSKAYNLLDQLPLYGDAGDVQLRAEARALILLRLKAPEFQERTP